jgi:hypothetical protein
MVGGGDATGWMDRLSDEYAMTVDLPFAAERDLYESDFVCRKQ